jgi:hypothetical protein
VAVNPWVDTGPPSGRDTLPSTGITGSGNGVSFVHNGTGGGPGGTWSFRYNLGQGDASDRLTGLEYVTWSSTFAKEKTFTDFALHVQGLTNEQRGSAWYTPSTTPPVPLPAAAWLFGSALIGFASLANRRKV